MLELNKLYCMDCMKGMKDFPDKYFDLAIVDPPYGLGNTNRLSKGKSKSIHKDFKWNNQIPNIDYFNELYRVSQNQIIWGCNYFHPFVSTPGRIVHNKKITIWGKGKNLSECDLASQSFNRKIEYFEYQWSGNVQGGKINWGNTGIDGRIHPTQKTIQLYKWILENYAKPDMKIIDTHVGSGSSIMAFLDFGCEWIGFEIDPDYHKATTERIERHKKRLKPFWNDGDLHKLTTKRQRNFF